METSPSRLWGWGEKPPKTASGGGTGRQGVALKSAHLEHGCTGAHQWGTNEPQLIFPVRAARPRSLGEQNLCFRWDPRSPEYGQWKSSRAPYRPSVALHLVDESSTTEASQGGKECGGPQPVSLQELPEQRAPDSGSGTVSQSHAPCSSALWLPHSAVCPSQYMHTYTHTCTPAWHTPTLRGLPEPPRPAGKGSGLIQFV